MTGRQLILSLLLIIALFASPIQAHAGVPVIVKLGSGSISTVTTLLGGTLVDSIPESGIYLLNTPSLPILSTTLKLLGVEWLEANSGVTLPPVLAVGGLTVPGVLPPTWYQSQPALTLVQAGQARNYSTGRSVVVADINSQFDYGHPALIGHMTSGYDFVMTKSTGTTALNQSSSGFLDQSSSGFLDQSSSGFLDTAGVGFLTQSSSGFLDGTNPAYSHGTLCAGLIVATAPDAMIMPLRAFDDNGSADVFTLAKAIRYAVTHGAHVINMSFGTLQNAKAMKEQIDFALKSNVVLIASAGNNDTSAVQYPAGYPGVVAVAATELTDKKTSFSNYGSMVFVDAPGSRIISAYPGNQYSIVSGTSFSAPIVAGTAALVRSLKFSGVTNALASSAVNIDAMNPNYVGKLGYGRINILKAVRP